VKRSALTAALAAATALLAACGTAGQPAPAPAPATPATAAPSAAPPAGSTAAPAIAPVGAPAPGIPALTGGDPTDLKGPVQAGAGTAAPPAGLLAQDVVVGDGPAATAADTVDVRYTGTLYSDGTAFDSSWSRGDEPVQFPLARVVPGFAQGIEGMQPGGRRVLVIPPELGYGSRATGPIPADSTLVFVVDLVSIG
jgi:peptidylprolyl isomerase